MDNTPVCDRIFESVDNITVHALPRKHFVKIFLKFWTECFRIFRKSWYTAYSNLPTYYCRTRYERLRLHEICIQNPLELEIMIPFCTHQLASLSHAYWLNFRTHAYTLELLQHKKIWSRKKEITKINMNRYPVIAYFFATILKKMALR